MYIYDFKPDPLIEAFDKAANEPIQGFIEKYLAGDEQAGWTLHWRFERWLTSTDRDYIQQFVADYEKKDPRSPYANCILGIIYHYGVGAVEKNEGKAKTYLTLAIPERCALAFVEYGYMAETSTIAKGYYDGALAIIPGYPPALNALASQQKETNPDNAFKLAKAGAEQGNPASLNKLAYYHSEAIGCSKDFKEEFNCYQKAATLGYSLYSLGIFYEHPDGYGVVQKDVNRAAYFYRVGHNPSCRRIKNDKESAKISLASLVKQKPKDFLLLYHQAIYLQDFAKLEELFKNHPTHFIECVFTYDLHRLQYEPWLKSQLTKLAETPTHPLQAQACHCLSALLTLATLDVPADKKARLQAAVSALTKITSITDVTSPYASIVLQTCLRVNHELTKFAVGEEKITPIDLHPKLVLFIAANPSFLFDETQGLPAILKSGLSIDDGSKALLESYAPHTRFKQKADLFDLQRYLALDTKWRKEDRKQLRKATYGLVLTTLAEEFKPIGHQSELKGESDQAKKPDIKERLGHILTNALSKEQRFRQGPTQEFSDILHGLQNNLDQVIREYQYFPQLFKKELEEWQKQAKDSSYSKTLALLQSTESPEPRTQAVPSQEPRQSESRTYFGESNSIVFSPGQTGVQNSDKGPSGKPLSGNDSCCVM